MSTTKHSGPIKLPAKPDSKLWVSRIPFGLGKVKPHHIRDTLKVAWDNRDALPYAYRMLTQGVCDGCALGVSGLYDRTLEGPHLCTTRLNLLRLNTMPAMKDAHLYADMDALRKLNSAELRKLGRIPYPLLREKGENRFRRITWDQALERIANKIRSLPPKQIAFYMTARGITNESYYVGAKTARFLGTNHIDNASRICHSPSKTALKRSVGVGASTCNYKDWIGTDVLVFWGSVAATNQPVSTKYMYAAKRKGTKIIVINPYHEPAMDAYWIPSVPESALFGTKLADDYYKVNIGGDIAFMNGVMKAWFEMEATTRGSAVDWNFIGDHTTGIEPLQTHIEKQSWTQLEASSGLSRTRMTEFAELLAKARTGVFVWSMGLTQHRFGTDNISQVANLALLRGFLGREHCGLMPIRGHSGVQGSGEMGADPFSLPGGEFNDVDIERIEGLWGFSIPRWHGDIVGVSLENALLPDSDERKLKLFYTSGGNFLETMPDPDEMRRALESVEIRVHQDIVFNTSTLVDAREAVIVLPAMTRYEQPGGGTSTSTERMVYFSPEIEGPRIGEARAEWQIYRDLAVQVHPERREQIWFDHAAAIREEIARAVPYYDGIQELSRQGDFFQWGGAWLCEGGTCPTPDSRGRLIPIELPELRKAEGRFYLTTRRGKQFNSLIFGDQDPFNGADRGDVLLCADDAAKLGLASGESIVVYNEHGRFQGRIRLADIRAGNAAMFWPEANPLLPKGVYEPHAGIPEYNTGVMIEKADSFYSRKDRKLARKPEEESDNEEE
ncbi:formate dehydrogenase [Paenibacillus swuensis]|uniref:Formate dehydrogenase n=1 Tax=Paenibacillus swuensis TaxID=1178515 RepID=A0A172TN61_9BACL|nr:FdhF/YdeP family oxidoreductase [Paenibacillus swuensis]ANE48478.1 formate dehydrogenase [Paenibacillus swuensis]